MPEIERRRAILDGDTVTIIGMTGTGRNADVEIRDQLGYTKVVKRKDLKLLDKQDDAASFTYHEA